jgi:CRISPR/Cas system-associated exonuclease Cas4 (RecB family)
LQNLLLGDDFVSSTNGEFLILCATSSQEGDLGRAAALSFSPEGDHVSQKMRVQNFAGYISQLWTRWGDHRELLGPAIRTQAIYELLEGKQDKRSEFDKSRLPKALLTKGGKRLLAQFVSSYIPPSSKELTQNKGTSLEVSQEYLQMTQQEKALLNLSAQYHELLTAKGYIEHQYAYSVLAERVRSGMVKLPHNKIIFVGFRDFTAAQLQVLLAFAEIAEVDVLLDWERNNPATEYLENTLKLLLEKGAIHDEEKNFSSNFQALDWLQSNFLKDKASQSVLSEEMLSELASSVRLGKAQGIDAEVMLMADFAQTTHRLHPHEPKALVLPRMQDYVRALTRELDRRQIPYELDMKTPFAATSFGAAFLALLKLCINEDHLSAALSFAASSCSGLSPDEVLELSTRWRKYRNSNTSILSQLSLFDTASSKAIGLIRGYDMSARIGDRNSLITQLYAFAADKQSQLGGRYDLLQEAAAQKAANAALQELYELKLATKLNSTTGDCKVEQQDLEQRETLPEDDGEFQQPGKRILTYDPRVRAEEIYALLQDASVAQTPRAASPAILIAEVSRIYGRQFHSLIAGGLSAKASASRQDQSLDKRLHAKLLGYTLPDITQQQALDYSSIVSAANSKLYLVTQSESLGGEELRAGEFLEAVEACLGLETCQKITQQKSNEDCIAEQSFSDQDKREKIKSLLAGIDVAQTTIPQHGKEAHYDFAFREHTPVSPTTLEAYAYCPYNWMLTRFAQGKEVERGFDQRRQGNFAHQVLKSFYEELQQSNMVAGERITASNLKSALKLLKQVFAQEEAQLREEIRLTAPEEAELVQIQHQLKAFLESEVAYAPEFTPRFFEYSFGHDESGPLDLGLGMPLRGSIDRIDLREDDKAAIIVDYKRTVTTSGLESQANNKQLQGILYRKAAQKALGINPIAHDYRSYTDLNKLSIAYSKEDNPPERPLGLPKVGRSKKQYGLSQEQVDRDTASIIQSSKDAAQGLKDGAITIRENNKPKCSYCPFEPCPHYKKARR